MLLLLLVFLGLCWWALMEYIRGRPKSSSNLSFALSFIGPLGAILFFLTAILVRFYLK